jgi:hypothetical protein
MINNFMEEFILDFKNEFEKILNLVLETNPTIKSVLWSQNNSILSNLYISNATIDDIHHIDSNFQYIGPLNTIWITPIIENPSENMIITDSIYNHISIELDKTYIDIACFIYVSKTTKDYIFEAYGNNNKITFCESNILTTQL